MYLTSLQVTNYRSLREFSIIFRPLNILIGRNDAGKSNVLRAIQLLLDDAAASQLKTYDWSKLSTVNRGQPKVITISGSVSDGSNEFIIRREIELGKKISSNLTINDKGNWRILSKAETAKIPRFYYLTPRTGLIHDAFNADIEHYVYTLTRDWMPAELKDKADMDKLIRKYMSSKDAMSSYPRFFEQEVYAPLKIAFPTDFRVMNFFLPFRASGDKNRLMVREYHHLTTGKEKAEFRLPLDYHGTALSTVTAIILAVEILKAHHKANLNGKPLAFGIEEPEVHLHPQAQRQFLDYFRMITRNHQMFITTHSPIFVDRSEPKNVALLKRAIKNSDISIYSRGKAVRGETIIIPGDYFGNWKETIESLGLRWSDALMSGDLHLLVEGDTEAILMPSIMETLMDEGKILFSPERVYVVNGKGVTNFPFVVATLQGTGNPVVVMVDDDTPGRETVKNLHKLSSPPEAILKPDTASLPLPLNRLKDSEFEDLFDARELLEAFNESHKGISGFEFLPIAYSEFDNERNRRIAKGEEYGWIYTVGALVGSKTLNNDIKKKNIGDRVTKSLVAKKAAEYIRDKRMAIPDFCLGAIQKIGELLKSRS